MTVYYRDRFREAEAALATLSRQAEETLEAGNELYDEWKHRRGKDAHETGRMLRWRQKARALEAALPERAPVFDQPPAPTTGEKPLDPSSPEEGERC